MIRLADAPLVFEHEECESFHVMGSRHGVSHESIRQAVTRELRGLVAD